MDVPQTFPDLTGKVAIITGAGSRADGIGNGRAASILLAEQGCKVVLVDLNSEWAAATHKMIQDEGKGESIVVHADVSIQLDCKRIVDTTMEKFGRLDILVNNVGIGGPKGDSVEVDLEEFNKAMNINVTSMVAMVKYAVPAMRKNSPSSGSIVNISSVSGLLGGHPGILYPVSKGAIIQMTRAMAAHYGKEGIRVNAICPGMLYTPMVYAQNENNGIMMTEEIRIQRSKRNMLEREGYGWDTGAAVTFLASGNARLEKLYIYIYFFYFFILFRIS